MDDKRNEGEEDSTTKKADDSFRLKLKRFLFGTAELREKLRSKPDQWDPTALTIPVYLDTIALFDILGTMMKGFSIVEEVTTQQATEETAKTSKGGEISVSPSFFKVGVEGSKGEELSSKASTEIKKKKMYTPEILFNMLRDKLNADELQSQSGTEGGQQNKERIPVLRNVINKELHSLEYVEHEKVKELKPGDFVELRGTLRSSSIADSLSVLIDAMGLAQPTNEVQEPRNDGSGPQQETLDQPASDQENLEKKIIKGYDRKSGESRTFLVDFSGSHQAT